METETQTAPPVPSHDLFGSWTPITERMPKIGSKVIVCGTYTRTGYQWRTMARWQPAGTIDATYWEEYPEGWESDDGDTITNPTDIWLEDPVEVEQAGFLENVTHWMTPPYLPNTPEQPPAPTHNDDN